MRSIDANAFAGGPATVAARESRIRKPVLGSPRDLVAPTDERASDQRVSASSRSSLEIARAIASRNPRGSISGNNLAAWGEVTTVSLRRLSMSFRPTRAYTGVTRPSHRLESQ